MSGLSLNLGLTLASRNAGGGTPTPTPTPSNQTLARGADTRSGAGGVTLNAIFGGSSPSWTVVQATGAGDFYRTATGVLMVRF